MVQICLECESEYDFHRKSHRSIGGFMEVNSHITGPDLEGPRGHNPYHQATDLDTTAFFFVFRMARAANRRFSAQIWGLGVQKRGNRCDFAENPASLNFKLLCFFMRHLHKKCWPAQHLHAKSTKNRLQTLRFESQKPPNP